MVFFMRYEYHSFTLFKIDSTIYPREKLLPIIIVKKLPLAKSSTQINKFTGSFPIVIIKNIKKLLQMLLNQIYNLVVYLAGVPGTTFVWIISFAKFNINEKQKSDFINFQIPLTALVF